MYTPAYNLAPPLGGLRKIIYVRTKSIQLGNPRFILNLGRKMPIFASPRGAMLSYKQKYILGSNLLTKRFFFNIKPTTRIDFPFHLLRLNSSFLLREVAYLTQLRKPPSYSCQVKSSC